jgi:BirA family transcriptional regulator, biotin operon repressor / biotin---[acetyl-CoA-carboxylase] ligase
VGSDASFGSIDVAADVAAIDIATIRAALAEAADSRIESIEHSLVLESTNRELLDGRPPPGDKARVMIAEFQTAGRGRRGRSWTMPAGAGVALSVSWRFATAPVGLAALGLAVGAAARRAIADVTGLSAGLKWPNDLIVDGGKLGGILIELAQLTDGSCHIVAGIGINVRLPPEVLAAVTDSPVGACDLAGSAPGWPIDRNAVAGALIERVVELFAGYATMGFEPYRAEWLAAHVLDGKAVELTSDAGTTHGIVHGIGSDGALIIESASGERRRFISGDVTVRARDARY